MAAKPTVLLAMCSIEHYSMFEVSTGTTTSMAIKRRHVDHWDPPNDSLSDEPEDILEDPIQQLPRLSRMKLDSRSWVDKYCPANSRDLCINPRKLKDVRTALSNMITGELNCRLLVLSGPSGSSKSTTIRCLAKELLLGKSNTLGGLVEFLDTNTADGALPMQFPDFLAACRYHIGSNLSVILIEELPNIFHAETLFRFRKAIKEWIFSAQDIPMPPLVLCLTELDSLSERDSRSYNIENCLTVETLLGKDLLHSASFDNRIQRIKFQPIAKTYLAKTINHICSAEHIRASKSVVQSFCESGDVRSLINYLQFWVGSKGNFSRFQTGRENQITLFHAIGKVIHSTSDMTGYDHDFSHDFHTIKNVMENYHDINLLLLGLLENYTIYNGMDFETSRAMAITESLSLSDTFGAVPEFKEYALLATRLELANVKAKGPPSTMKFPRQFRLQKEQNKVSSEISNYRRYIAKLQVLRDDINLIDGNLVPKILNSFRYKMAHDVSKEQYQRVGGAFKKLFAEETPSIMENEDEAERGNEDQFRSDINEIARQEDNNKEDDDDDLSDAIENSTDEEDLEDTLDEQFLAMTQQRTQGSVTPKITIDNDINNDDDNGNDEDMQDDPELDFLVSQGIV